MGTGERHDEGPGEEPDDDPAEALDDDPAGPHRPSRGSLPDPLDRVWVHPTELAPTGAGPSTSPPSGAGTATATARRRTTTWLAPVLAGTAGAMLTVVVLAVSGAFDASKATTTEAAAERETTNPTAPRALDALARLSPSVVAVVATDARGTRRGSAVCIRHGAELLTSSRVVGSASTVQVESGAGRRSTARVVGRDLVTDLVLLAMPDDANVPAAPLAEQAPATGSPVWLLGASTPGTTGGWRSNALIASGGAMVVDKELGPMMLGLVETDTASPSAAAGGALVDGSGRVAGIVLGRVNSHAANSTYAVSIEVAIGVAQQLDATGVASHGSLGVRGVDTQFGPMIVAMAKDTPAARAGLHVRDLVMTVDGHAVRSVGDVTAVVRSLPPGRVVPVGLRRGDRAVEIRVELGATSG